MASARTLKRRLQRKQLKCTKAWYLRYYELRYYERQMHIIFGDCLPEFLGEKRRGP